MNFKRETLDAINNNGHAWSEVLFIQGNDFRIENTNDEALDLMNFDYDCGFGSPEIAEDLKIVGKDWWLERHEYDGSEWWEYKEIPKPLENTVKIERFNITPEQVGWKTLDEVNFGEY